MTTEAARAIFDAARDATTCPDARARIELCREYFTNPAFRKALVDYTWAATTRATTEA